MIFGTILERFVERSPACVMVRGTMENVVTPGVLDDVFEQAAQRQYCRELLFSSVVDLLGLVANRNFLTRGGQLTFHQGNVTRTERLDQGVEVLPMSLWDCHDRFPFRGHNRHRAIGGRESSLHQRFSAYVLPVLRAVHVSGSSVWLYQPLWDS
jgi:hypothetical protein